MKRLTILLPLLFQFGCNELFEDPYTIKIRNLDQWAYYAIIYGESADPPGYNEMLRTEEKEAKMIQPGETRSPSEIQGYKYGDDVVLETFTASVDYGANENETIKILMGGYAGEYSHKKLQGSKGLIVIDED